MSANILLMLYIESLFKIILLTIAADIYNGN